MKLFVATLLAIAFIATFTDEKPQAPEWTELTSYTETSESNGGGGDGSSSFTHYNNGDLVCITLQGRIWLKRGVKWP